MKKSISAILFFLLLSPLTYGSGPAVSDPDASVALQEFSFNATVRVRQVGIGRGTGFFIYCSRANDAGERDVYLLTAYHCVDGESDIFIETVNAHDRFGWFLDRHDAELIAFDEQADVAVLRTTLTKRVPTLKIARRRDSVVNSFSALTIGCSDGEYPTVWSETVLGLIEKKSENDWEVSTKPIHGRSGGPLISTKLNSENFGCFLGVCIRISKEGHGIYSDLEKTRSVLRSAGLPARVVNGGSATVSFSVLSWLLVKLCIAIFATSIVRVK